MEIAFQRYNEKDYRPFMKGSPDQCLLKMAEDDGTFDNDFPGLLTFLEFYFRLELTCTTLFRFQLG